MMQHHTAPCHKPSLSLSSMELVLSPSYASAANSSITGSSASASAIEASASASTSGGVPSSSSSSSKKKNCNHGHHEEDNDNLSFHPSPVGSSIPHLLSTDCDNDSDDDDDHHYNNGRHTSGRGSYEEGFIASSARSNSFTHLGNGTGNNEDGEGNDQFQSMLLDQQRRADEPCLDDSVIYHHQHGSHDADSQFTYPTQTASSLPPPSSSPPLEDDVESSMSLLQTNEERSHYFHRQHRDNHNRTSTGKNLLSKFSRSAETSRQQTWEVVPPITMMIDLDDNDEDLPWMLSQPGFGVIDAAGTRGNSYESNSSGDDEEDGRTSPLDNEQQPSTTTLPTHRRYPSSLSSTSSQSSFRSILRNGINSSGSAESSRKTITTSSIIGPASTASNRTPLMPRSNNRYDESVAAGVLEEAGSDLRRVGARGEPESLITLGSSTGRGRSIHVQDHQTNRGRRSKCQSAQKSKRNGDVGSALAVASSSTGKDCHSHQHRRSVSFPAELIAKDDDKSCKTAPRHPRRDGSKSPRSLPPPGSQYDPNLTPLLDMGSSRTRKKLPAHVIQNVSEISPRTADFLAHEPVAVTTLCKLQDRERYGHLLGPSTLSRATPATTTTVPPSPSNSNWGCNTYPPPAASSHSPAKRLNASYQRKLQFGEASNRPGGSRPVPNNVLGTDQEGGIDNDYLSPSSKLAVFSFSHGNRRGRVMSSSKPGRRRKRLSNVDLLSPVEEIGAGVATSTTTSMAITPRVTGQDKQPYSLPARRNNIDSQPSFASDGSCEVRSGSISVSPLTSELQKAADAVWRDAETAPSSASASASASSKSSFTVVGTQCQCIIS